MNIKTSNEIKSTAYSKYMSVSHSICTEVQKKRNIRQIKEGHRRNIEKAVRTEGSRNNRRRSVHRSYTYAGKYPAAHKYSTVYGISQGKKFFDDI